MNLGITKHVNDGNVVQPKEISWIPTVLVTNFIRNFIWYEKLLDKKVMARWIGREWKWEANMDIVDNVNDFNRRLK